MLPRKYKLKKENHFKKIFQKGKAYQGEFMRLKVLNNNLKISRFAFVVGLKISKKATQRNKIRRQLEEIVRLKLNQISPGLDAIVLVSPEITKKKYQNIEKCLLDLLQKAKITWNY